jgi:hypothetical protein
MPTTAPILNKDIAFSALAEFFRETPFVFFGTGLSCGVDRCFGMVALQTALGNAIHPSSLSAAAAPEWEALRIALASGLDLENALNEVSSDELLSRIRLATADHLVGKDHEFSWKLTSGEVEWPAARLIARLVESLPEGDPSLHVLTPNYDLLFEHAMDRLRVPLINGFHGGISRRLDWTRASLQHATLTSVGSGQRSTTVAKQQKHLRLYKVHGSLSYFYHDNQLVENHTWAWNPPSFAERVMVTPGQSKFAVLQSFRRELQTPVDTEIDRASRFLFMGYGFNDSHLETYIRRKLVTQQSHALILTKDKNPRIESLAANAQRVWVVTAPSDGTPGCHIYNAAYPSPLTIPDVELWRADIFARTILNL